MADNSYYDLYRKLTETRHKPTEGLSALSDFILIYRERKSSASSHEELLAEADHCLHEIAHSSNLFVAAISSLLTVNKDVNLANALIQKASVLHLQQDTAEDYDLTATDEGQAILAGCRLCTLNAATAISLGWALSLFASYPESNMTNRAVEYLLQYHIDEFPWTTRRLLASDKSPFKTVEMAKKTLALLEEQEAWLTAQPRLREFAMSTQ